VAELVDIGPPRSFGERVFVRPDSALKPFSGRVLATKDISLAALDHGFYYDDLDLPAVVAPTAQLEEEWRFVVVDSEIVAGSSYLANGREAGASLDASTPAWDYAARLSRRLAPPDPVYVLDICETDRSLRLLELNPFSGADLYDCDRAVIVAAVERGLGHL
jgi:ATP-grasp domain-containing protein